MLQPSSLEQGRPAAWRRLWHALIKRRLLLLILAALVVASLALYQWLQPPRNISITTVTRGDISATVTANARVRSVNSARLSFPFAGQLAKLEVQEGDVVKAGDVLAELKADDLDRRTQQAQLNLSSRQLDLERSQAPPRAEDIQIAQSSVKKAALALAAAQNNADKNPSTTNVAARDAAQADYDAATASFDRLTRGPTDQELLQLKNAVAAAQLDLDSARAQRSQAQLTAPYDAIVTQLDAAPGELVGGFTPVVEIADLTRLELLADIDEIDVGSVAAGQSVDIRFDAFPGESVKGRLTILFPAASEVRGALVYHARISFDLGKLGIRPGMGATCKIATVEKKDVLLVPTRAIRSAGTQKIVTSILNGVQQNVVVETGVSDGINTEIISGLQEGGRIVVE